MNKELTEIVFILDKSGSMSGLEKDTIGGYNSFLEKQKKAEGEALVSTVLFSDRNTVLHDRVPISSMELLTDKDYMAGGSTALLDAIGSAIHHIKNVHKYMREEDRPAKTVFVITTDGEENSSSEYSYSKIKEMIEVQQKESGWEFLFLGANIDAIGEAGKLGIRADRAVRYECDAVGTALNFETVGEAMCCLRSGSELKADWSDDISNYQKKGRKKAK